MVIAFLAAHPDLHLVVASVARGLQEVLWEELALLVEVIPRSLLHQSPWNEDVLITPTFILHKQQTDLLQFKPAHAVAIIYFDAFAPASQPELWTEDVFKKLYQMLHPGGVLVTYCSKGVVRRAMQAAGFAITKIPGPPGKREMVRANPLSP